MKRDDVLKNQTVHTTNHYSRYAGVKEYTNTLDTIGDTDEYKHQLALKTWLKQDVTTQVYKIKKNDTWDSIALYFYKNPTYYWILCDYNRVVDPMQDLIVGDTILIPTLSSGLTFDTYA